MSYVFFYSSEGESDASLASVISSACFDVDATIEDSYGGSGAWKNLISSPADGASQSDYDFTNNVMTFNGTVGDQAAYWTNPTTSGNFQLSTNTTLTANLHQAASTQDWWLCFAFRKPTGSGGNYLAATRISSRGVLIRDAGFGSPEFSFLQQNSGGSVTLNSGSTWFTDDADNIGIISYDASADTTRFWLNSTTSVSDAGAPASGTDAANAAMRLFSFADATARFYHASMGNELLDDTKASDIISFLETRHGRDYTP